MDTYTIELNEYIEHQDEVANHLEYIRDNLSIDEVLLKAGLCKYNVVRRIKSKIENMGLTVKVEY